MRVRRPRAKAIRWYSVERDAGLVIAHLSEVLEEDAGNIKGYLVVGVRKDNTIIAAHNSCCLPHMIGLLVDQVITSPELAEVRPEHAESHRP